MSVASTVAKIRNRRLSFTTFKAAANYYKLPTSNGWAGVEEKLTAKTLTPSQTKEYLATLQKIYEDNIHFGNKAVQIATVKVAHLGKLRALYGHTFAPGFEPGAAFPSPISASDLRKLTLTPKLVTSVRDEEKHSVTVYFYAKGYETEREQFDVDQMTDEVSRARFAGYDHVVAVRQNAFLRMDAVQIDLKHKHIEFRVDITHISSLEQIDKALGDLKSAFRKYLEAHVDEAWEKVEFLLMNFYPKIDFVYNSKSGMVVKLAQNTASGAINHEKMRGMKGDLREESYHKAGKSAVATQAFSITTSFPYDKGYSRVHLSIPGKSAQASAPDPTLNTAIIEDCFREEQFNDMINILR